MELFASIPKRQHNETNSGRISHHHQFFQKSGWHFDMNKMIDTAGQMMAVMNQFSSVVKGLGSVFKQS
ncbi:MAG: hypothetical protein IMW92_06110 [Bacillales bacterium]|nr:hypothetical protein [Bacillales bacterium]